MRSNFYFPSCFLPALHPLQSDRAQSGAAPILSGAAARHLLELFRLQLEDDNARRKADWIKDDWHSILNRRCNGIWSRREDRAGLQRFVA